MFRAASFTSDPKYRRPQRAGRDERRSALGAGSPAPTARWPADVGSSRRDQRIRRRLEHSAEAVTGGGEDLTSDLLDRRPDQMVVEGERGPHGLRVTLPQPRRSLDVGEQERDNRELLATLFHVRTNFNSDGAAVG